MDSQALSSQQSSQSSDQPSHSSSNYSEQSKHVADSHPLQPPQKTLNSSQSTQQSSCGPQSLFPFSPLFAQPEMPRAADSSTPRSSGWIPATFKSSDLELAAVASLRSAELSISNDGSPTLFNESSQATVSQPSQTLQHSPASQHSQSSRPSVQDDDNMGDTSLSWSHQRDSRCRQRVLSSSQKACRSMNSSQEGVFRSSTAEAYDSSPGNL